MRLFRIHLPHPWGWRWLVSSRQHLYWGEVHTWARLELVSVAEIIGTCPHLLVGHYFWQFPSASVCFSLQGVLWDFLSLGISLTGISLAYLWCGLESAEELMLPEAALPQWEMRIEAAPWWWNCEVCATPSHLGPQWYWAPAAHSDNWLINTVCIDFLLFLCPFLLPACPGIASQTNCLPRKPLPQHRRSEKLHLRW